MDKFDFTLLLVEVLPPKKGLVNPMPAGTNFCKKILTGDETTQSDMRTKPHGRCVASPRHSDLQTSSAADVSLDADRSFVLLLVLQLSSVLLHPVPAPLQRLLRKNCCCSCPWLALLLGVVLGDHSGISTSWVQVEAVLAWELGDAVVNVSPRTLKRRLSDKRGESKAVTPPA